jgi:hypothetical protein
MAKISQLRLNGLAFTGKDGEFAGLDFRGPLSFIYGASNTGKSFAAKAIDYMLGGSRELPNIIERRPYINVQLEIQVDHEKLTFERFLGGGDFRLLKNDGVESILSSRHASDNEANFSNFMLRRLNIDGKELARDKAGTKKPLSFRDIVRFCITDETSIQSEVSPVESGDKILAPVERNAFKYLLTGVDDSAYITQEKPKDFSTGKTAQLRFIQEMLGQIDIEIAEDFPDIADLDAMREQTDAQMSAIENDIVAARASVRALLEQKHNLVAKISVDQQRVNDIAISLENFEQLQLVYASDIARLETLEEAGFLLGMDANKACPVCGAPPEAQLHDHGLIEIEKTRLATEAEIAKIRLHQSELQNTTDATRSELAFTGERLLESRKVLSDLEVALTAASPNADEQRRQFSEIIPRRDRINRGFELLKRRDELEKQRIRIEKSKLVRSKTNFQSGLSTEIAQEFADEVSNILTAWGFPGSRRVVFDLQSYDLIIDGKHRKDNGKGVRAITHAAFKVAMLTYCRERNLPHPGFLVLDTPLITYRDPIRSRLGPLSPDEREIGRTNLKELFFKHLSSLGSVGQFILFDNADPPEGAGSYTFIQAFTNDPEQGRQGLLKIARSP